MALTSDAALFRLIETEDIAENLDTIIVRSLKIKKDVVEQDVCETGLRRVLNFGHTIGHGIEASSTLYHGEAVALGMLPLCGDAIRPRVIAVLQKCALYRTVPYDWDKIARAAFHDKKADGDTVCVTMVDEIGSFRFVTMPCADVIAMARKYLEGQDT